MRRKTHQEYPDRDLIPEHTKRQQQGTVSPEVEAAYQYVTAVKDTSDYHGQLAWHGWALREAFLAGISHAHQKAEANMDRLVAAVQAFRNAEPLGDCVELRSTPEYLELVLAWDACTYQENTPHSSTPTSED